MSRTTKEINKITGTIIAISSRLILLAIVLLVLFEGGTWGYEFGHEIFSPTAVSPPPGTTLQIEVVKEESASTLASELKKQNMITNRYAFIIQAGFYDYELKPGSYTINSSMTSKEILELINEGEAEETVEKETKS